MSELRWHTEIVGGKPVEVLQPQEPVRFAIIYLHSFQGESLSERPTWEAEVRGDGLLCVVPKTGPSWWADRIYAEFDTTMTPEAFIVRQLTPWLRSRWSLGERRLGLLGVDMGGQGALRLAFRYPDTFPAVAAVAPSIEYHELYWSGLAIDSMYSSKEECRQDTALMHINPYHVPPHIFFAADPEDPWWRGSDRLREKLVALGVSHICDLTTRGGGHRWESFDRHASTAVRFLREALEKESRRLL